jgi:hypothetical protein
MKKMLKKLPTFMLGAVVGITLTAGTAVGAATYLKATQSNVKIVVDGTQVKLSDSPLNVNGRLYLPVRDTANALGYSVESVTSSKVSLKEGTSASNTTTNNGTTSSNNGSTGGQSGTGATNPSNSNSGSSSTTASKKVKNLRETYSTDGKLDAEKIRTALNNGTLDVNAQDSDTMDTLLHFAVLDEDFEAYKAIKRNALSPNIQNKDGQTALMLAVINDRDFYFGEIKDMKPDVTIKDKAGKQAIDYADPKSTYYSSLRAYALFNNK